MKDEYLNEICRALSQMFSSSVEQQTIKNLVTKTNVFEIIQELKKTNLSAHVKTFIKGLQKYQSLQTQVKSLKKQILPISD